MNSSIGRRAFIRQAVTAAGGCLLVDGPRKALAGAKARHCIFILMAGGPSQADTFDLEEGPWTPAAFEPATFGEIRFPRGLMPRIACQMDSVLLLRGVRAPTTSHPVAQAGLPAFRSLGISGEESVYGERCWLLNSPFDEACSEARALVRTGGAHWIEITIGGWDNHSDIYETALNARDAKSVARRFDAGLGALLAGLRSDGLLPETLIVAMGEFGRTPGPLNLRGGRDHFPRHAVLVAGAGICGARAIREDREGAMRLTLGDARNPVREPSR